MTFADACHLPPVAGPCTGSKQSFYYDADVKSCREFEYRGCLGNNNRFATRHECNQVCVMPLKLSEFVVETKLGDKQHFQRVS